MARTIKLKALTIRQPWAWATIYGGKDIENRSWATRYRGPLVIHAGQGFDRHELDYCSKRATRRLPEDFEHGVLIGIVDVLDCVERHRSRWFVGDYGFVLGRPRAFAKPIPFKGRLGLFDVELPARVVEAARRIMCC